MRVSLTTIAQWLGCPAPEGAETLWVEGVAFDSRQVRPKDLFVAAPGEKTDGHLFVSEAASRGAVAALVARPVDASLPQLVVSDTVSALQALASRLRQEAGFQVAAVTGSVGKTTTKSMLAALLARRFRLAQTQGSRNSQLGLPAEMCNLNQDVDWFVAEAGMSRKGELTRLGEVLRPQALLYTRIAPVHLEFFPSVEAIAEAKAELIPFLDPQGVLVLNATDPYQENFASRFSGRKLSYGLPGKSDVWADQLASRGLLGTSFTLAGPLGGFAVDLPLPGLHQVENFLGAACLARAMGVPVEELAAAAGKLRAQPHRGEVHRLPSGAVLVDDSYNASPVAVARMLELLAQTPGRRVAVLGEMLELGPQAPDFHREVGAKARGLCHRLVAVGGENARVLAEAFGTEGTYVASAEEAEEVLENELREGDVVLIKGSRGIGLDRLVAALLAGRG
ncbi:MAG: UDP-N-acetylmuramoyl-tripeptide--D-alanyl-D-alanine ligase [Acidobacteriota bacterium]